MSPSSPDLSQSPGPSRPFGSSQSPGPSRPFGSSQSPGPSQPMAGRTLARFSELEEGGSIPCLPQDNDDCGWDEVFDGLAPAPSLPQMEVGDNLGAFVLQERLGEGGMGTVFRAQHRLLGRSAAIKVLLPELAQQRDVVARFFREAQAVNLIRHPNIVDISDFVDSPEHPPFLIMELLEGESLAHYVSARGPLSPRVVIAIGMQICSAMAAVHAKGIIHRDLKPDNIFVHERQAGSNGALKVKLLDFGIAKFMESEGQLVRTATGVPIGTPEYMAPEQIRGVGVDARTDIYSVGVILFELLTGRVPFVSSQIGEILVKHLEEAPVAPSSRRPSGLPEVVPRALDEAVLACLAKDPADRIQSMGQLAELLDWADTSEMSSVVVIGDPAAFSRRRWPWLVGAALAGLAILVLFLVGSPRGEVPVPDAAKLRSTLASSRKAASEASPGVAAEVLVVSRPAGAALFKEANGQFLAMTPARIPLPQEGVLGVLVRREGHRPVSLHLTPDTHGPVEVLLGRDAEPPEKAKAQAPEPEPPEASVAAEPPAHSAIPRPRASSEPAGTPGTGQRSRTSLPKRSRESIEPASPSPMTRYKDETVDPFQ